jgi:carbamoyltransferase
MNYVGISAGFHDAAISVVNNSGDILFAAHSERYSKVKHDKDVCADLLADALAYVDSDSVEYHYYERPWIKAVRQLRSGEGLRWPTWDQLLGNVYNHMGRPRVHTHGHHLCHAAAGFQTSPYNDATVVVIDAIGEFDTVTIWDAAYNDETNCAEYKNIKSS